MFGCGLLDGLLVAWFGLVLWMNLPGSSTDLRCFIVCIMLCLLLSVGSAVLDLTCRTLFLGCLVCLLVFGLVVV